VAIKNQLGVEIEGAPCVLGSGADPVCVVDGRDGRNIWQTRLHNCSLLACDF